VRPRTMERSWWWWWWNRTKAEVVGPCGTKACVREGKEKEQASQSTTANKAETKGGEGSTFFMVQLQRDCSVAKPHTGFSTNSGPNKTNSMSIDPYYNSKSQNIAVMMITMVPTTESVENSENTLRSSSIHLDLWHASSGRFSLIFWICHSSSALLQRNDAKRWIA